MHQPIFLHFGRLLLSAVTNGGMTATPWGKSQPWLRMAIISQEDFSQDFKSISLHRYYLFSCVANVNFF